MYIYNICNVYIHTYNMCNVYIYIYTIQVCGGEIIRIYGTYSYF